jgi:oligopeptide/dipeptide ABC transporter ATP-binding protein
MAYREYGFYIDKGEHRLSANLQTPSPGNTADRVPLLAVEGLVKHFAAGGLFERRRVVVRALDGVSFDVRRGETFGLVGESGCGKTTLGRLVVRLIEPTAGRIVLEGRDISRLSARQMLPFRRRLQMIFQDPYASLDPRMKVGDIVTEPLLAAGTAGPAERRRAAAELLAAVGLPAADADRHPHEFSGGQRQRIGIARALCVRPDLVVADEPVSALDVSVKAQVLNLMQDLKERFGLSYLLISHDLSVVGHLCDRIAVMYLGRIVEIAPAAGFYSHARHPYARALIASIPVADPRRAAPPAPIAGEVADPACPPRGCAFHPRCPRAADPCHRQPPPLVAVGPDHRVACWVERRD